jgi:hypothetical protein
MSNMSASVEQKKVKLTSSEGTEFQVERNVAERSVLLKNMLEDVGENDMGKSKNSFLKRLFSNFHSK